MRAPGSTGHLALWTWALVLQVVVAAASLLHSTSLDPSCVTFLDILTLPGPQLLDL